MYETLLSYFSTNNKEMELGKSMWPNYTKWIDKREKWMNKITKSQKHQCWR